MKTISTNFDTGGYSRVPGHPNTPQTTVRTDDIPIARIADAGWASGAAHDGGSARLYRGRVWVGGRVVCEAIRTHVESWQAGEDADWLCMHVRESSVDLDFRAHVRCVLVAAASLPMVCLGILEDTTDEELEALRVAHGDATDVACHIANLSVEC